MNLERGTIEGNGMYRKLIVFIQAVAAVGILVIAVITWIGPSTSELRLEMQEEFKSVRAEMRSFRTEMQEEFKAVRTEMQEEFKAVREEMRSFRSEMQEEHADIRADIHDMNTRLGRVEGEVRALTQGSE